MKASFSLLALATASLALNIAPRGYPENSTTLTASTTVTVLPVTSTTRYYNTSSIAVVTSSASAVYTMISATPSSSSPTTTSTPLQVTGAAVMNSPAAFAIAGALAIFALA